MNTLTRHAPTLVVIMASIAVMMPSATMPVTTAQEHSQDHADHEHSSMPEHTSPGEEDRADLPRSARRFLKEHFPFIIDHLDALHRDGSPEANHQYRDTLDWIFHFVPEMREMQQWNADTFKIERQVMQLDHESERLGARMQEIAPGAEMNQMATTLESMLIEAFALKQQQRRLEAAKMEQELQELKAVIQRREARRDRIIDRRFQNLTGAHDLDEW